MTDWTIETGDPSTMPSVVDLLRRCELPDTGVVENAGGFVVARDGSAVVGCCGLEVYDAAGLFRSLAVEPSHRGRGIAAALVSRILAGARVRKVSVLYLLTTNAGDYFSRHGFEICARNQAPAGITTSWEFRTGCPDSAVLMRRVV